MKKLAILTMVISFMMMGTIYAQQSKSNQKPVAEYIKNTIAPAVKQAQQQFIQSLSQTEQKELAQIQSEMNAFRAKAKQMQRNRQGNFNKQQWANRRAKMQSIMAKVEKIVAAHPNAAKAYTDFIKSNAPKWEAEIGKLRQANGNGVNRPMSKRSQFLFQKLSDPAFGLIVNTDRLGSYSRTMMRPAGRMQPNRRGYGNPQGNRGGQRGNWNKGCGPKRGNMQGYHHGMPQNRGDVFMAMRNPKVKARMLTYAKENIFPVVSQYREAFDKELKGSEKRTIEKARVELEKIHQEMQAYFQNKGRKMGIRNDSLRLAMRLKVEEATLPVQQIAIKHYSDIKTYVSKIRQDFMGWGNGMKMIAKKGMQPGFKGHMKGRNNKGMRPGSPNMKPMGMIGPVKFLLYNPSNPEASFPMLLSPMQAAAPAK